MAANSASGFVPPVPASIASITGRIGRLGSGRIGVRGSGRPKSFGDLVLIYRLRIRRHSYAELHSHPRVSEILFSILELKLVANQTPSKRFDCISSLKSHKVKGPNQLKTIDCVP